MIKVIQKAAYRHGYLFIMAAWLYTISFVFTNYITYSASYKKVQKTLNSYIAKQENVFNQFLSDTSLLNVVAAGNSKLRIKLSNASIGVFTYEYNDLGNPIESYWNTNKMAINHEDLLKPDGSYPVSYQNGFFELIKITVNRNDKKYIIAGLIPIRWNYFVEIRYLKSEFAGYPDIENLYRISKNPNAMPVTNSKGAVLFTIERKSNVANDHPDAYSLALRVMAIIFFLVFINSLANDVTKEKGFVKGFIFIFSILVILRVITYQYLLPFDFRRLELFDPAVYASNIIHPSLGDLLLNSVFLFWIVSFIKFKTLSTWDKKIKYPFEYVIGVAVISSFILALTTIEMAGIIRSLVVDSNISFDVMNFYGLGVYTVISFVIICFLVLSFYHLSHLLILTSKKAGIDLYWHIVMVVACGLLILSFNVGTASTPVKVATLVWLIGYMLLLNYREKDMRLSIFNSSFFLFWAMIFSASIALLIVFENKTVELEQRKKIAEKLALQTDPSSESLLSIAITNFSSYFLDSNFYKLKTQRSNRFIKDSLINENFTGYLNKYDTKIYTFDNKFRPLFNEDSTSYQILESIITNQGKSTSVPNLYYYENASDRFSYLYEKRIVAEELGVMGYLVIVVKPKRYKSEALTPELFKQVKDISTDLNINYSYALYSRLRLVNNFNEYSFPDTLLPTQVPKFEFEVREGNRYNELWYNTGSNKVVVVARKNTWFIESLTLFAYLFCSFITVVLMFHFFSFIFRERFRWKKIKMLFNLNIRRQIQATIIFISIFSFVVIGAATISFFISRFKRNNAEKLLKEIQIMVKEIEEKKKSQLLFTDDIDLNELGLYGDLERKISEIAEIHNADINYYDIDGNLKFSTQPYIYDKDILSDKMQPAAFYQLNNKHLTKYIQQENIGKFTYLSMYMPVRETNGTTVSAYLNIPYLNSQNELHQEISNFLVTLINLNALIFVLAGAIAVLLTNRITLSFSLIGNKMKEINLSEINEEITWKYDDEIGTLVNEYNKMVKKLEYSAETLARSEREGAWREMARQVAHEIKNPLTPMKLSIQYLQKAVNDGYANVKELSQHVAATLVEQIDQLSHIAGDFSQFANIGNILLEKFDVNEVLQSVVNLYSSDGHVQITWRRDDGKFDIFADKVQIIRLFTNLIKNAVEASEKDNSKAEITISNFKENDNVIISIADQGTGIPAAIQKKIFIPNFTTKSSGTGLGLAICKGIVEKANGKIWFETEENKGTTFYIALPLMEKE